MADTATNATTAPRVRRPFDSSKTRVAPVFNALCTPAQTDAQWARRLLDLASYQGDSVKPWSNQDLSIVDSFWAPKEKGLHPPIALLSWLIRNVAVVPEKLSGPPAAVEHRKRLCERDPATIELALTQLRTGGARRGWFVLEGPSYPDAYLVTKDALIVVEGKRTEAGPTTSTSFMELRHQMLRHLDAAWEIRGHRSVYGLMIVEGTEADGEVPELWRRAALDTVVASVIDKSLPHRSAAEQNGIAEAFVGVTTWQQIVRAFALESSVQL